ncbi:MAG: magnesium transporter CorA family protein [Clostridiales bacterium]|jgi:magnesium transporter|nr:magnesium transporter CorA family protein [Clostridiales bacterium]
MRVYDFSGENAARHSFPETIPSDGVFAVCRAGEVPPLSKRFGWDESTTIDCIDLDETVRYTSYDRYDFISLIYIEPEDGTVIQREINLFFSKQYLVLVLPERSGSRLEQLETELYQSAESAGTRPNKLARLYYLVFSGLAADYSDTLEELEDKMEALAESVSRDAEESQIEEIGRLRKSAYTAKKILRALSYIGEDILIDENRLLDKRLNHYFRGIDTRLKKLYDFADSLYELSGELLHTYDSKLAIKMNETVNKLTVITLFFGPLTVITGIYGMNFTHMPELDWQAGYPIALAVMALVSMGIYAALKKRKWL